MHISKTAKIVSNSIYAFGCVIFLALACFALFGASLVPYPDAMIPYSMRDYAVVGLAMGSIPFLFASMAVYKFNLIKQNLHKKRNFLLIFSPCFLCGICLLFIIGLIGFMLIKTMLRI